jgi:3-phenylpropionate/cinnamic acid dioxygenase small subunit
MTDATPTDFLAVVDVLHRHAEGMDCRDWAGFRSVFTDEVDIDYSSHRPGQVFRTSADEWTAHVSRRLGRLTATQHALSNAQVQVDDAGATCTMYVRAEHVLGHGREQRHYTIGGRYVDRLVRNGTSWLICAVTLESWWFTGDRDVLELPPL